MKLKEIETLLYVESGAPVPTVLSNEYKLVLLYYFDKQNEKDEYGYTDTAERNKHDTGIASIKFINHIVYKFGYPNIEVLGDHPYYSYGLKPYRIFEVEESGWISEIEKISNKHPFHDSKKFKLYRHFIIVFSDSCFECIALGMELNYVGSLSMQQALEQAVVDFL